MYQKQKGLSMDSKNPEKFYAIEKNILIGFCGDEGQEKKGGEKWGRLI